MPGAGFSSDNRQKTNTKRTNRPESMRLLLFDTFTVTPVGLFGDRYMPNPINDEVAVSPGMDDSVLE